MLLNVLVMNAEVHSARGEPRVIKGVSFCSNVERWSLCRVVMSRGKRIIERRLGPRVEGGG